MSTKTSPREPSPREPSPLGGADAFPRESPLEKVRAYAQMAGVAADPPPLPVLLVPEEGRRALFRSLAAVLPLGV